jgi:predicted aldo/keto reductase-like oxidoreductase
MALRENWSRRKFLFGGALALTPMACNRFDAPSDMAAAAQSASIIKRKLGKTGFEIPIVSMGVMNADNPAVVQESYKLGIRFFDTARTYQNGNNEKMLGEVVSRLGVRDQVYIQTKARCPLLIKQSTPEQRKQALLGELDGSLTALAMDYVDIFLLHCPTIDEMTDPGIKEALTEMKKLKKARYVGISHHQGQAEALNAAVKEGIYDTATVSCNFTMAQDTALFNAIRNAANAGLGVIAMKTQIAGQAEVNQTAALKWALNHPEITTAIPGYTNFDHMKEDFSVAYGLGYNSEEKKFLADKNLQASVQFCRQCLECRTACPNGVDIPTLMRTHMYAAKYGNFVHARDTLEEIAENVSLKNCADCSACNAKCANYVNIAGNIRDLKAMYL